MAATSDTIYAPSSAIGGAIAVLRISGGEAADTTHILDRDITLHPRTLLHVHALDGDELVDDCMAVFLPAPHTYTGESMVEINCHGGVETVRRMLALLGKLGFRAAEGGEFTRRAFLNGKMDLSQAEAVMDLINATAEQSRKAALLQLTGFVGKAVGEVEESLLDALSGIDAAIDYPDEVEDDMIAALPQVLGDARIRLEDLIRGGLRGKVLRDGLRVAILGSPNVGKSSLMNALLGTERAIVTPNAGTTRDVLDEPTSFDGVPIRLIDTAGIREASDEAEQIGVSRARAAMSMADVVCLVLDGARLITPQELALLEETADYRRIVVMNKSDLPHVCEISVKDALRLSAKTGAGLDTLKKRILSLAGPEEGNCAIVTNQRHLHAMEDALSALKDAARAPELDLAATDLHNALHALGSITGTDVDEQVIDKIFANFCVGK